MSSSCSESSCPASPDVSGRLEDESPKLDYGFIVDSAHLEHNCAMCPATMAVLDSIGGLIVAGLSRLVPGGVLSCHRDDNPSSFTVHLGLDVPDPKRCQLVIYDDSKQRVKQRIQEEEGKAFMFDDAQWHMAYNRTDHHRTILYLNLSRSYQ